MEKEEKRAKEKALQTLPYFSSFSLPLPLTLLRTHTHTHTFTSYCLSHSCPSQHH